MSWERETGRTQKRGPLTSEGMFWGAVPETTVFTVVSDTHPGVVFAHVPETTAKIGVSGTWGDEDKQAEDKEEAKQEK